MIGGAGFIADNLAIVLAPAYASCHLLVSMGVVGIPFVLRLLAKGVDVPKWKAMAAADT